ncbi:hypothetical protein RB195_000488 [Necator americanus]|uniref:Uncharacterized protein n=1 Tax=Necator americanus TaxID=51031 RepID=A0ABR1DAP7_NECAM
MCRASRITTISALGMYLIRSTFALICPIPSSGGVPVRNKTCPDFKADPSFIYCCTSKLPPTSGIYREKHGVFCCSLADFEKERQEIADEEFHNFIKQYLAVIIICSLLAIGLTLTATSLLCKRMRKCPLYRDNSMLTHSVQAATMYRPVDTIPPKVYEAPPPYECFVPPPPDQARNDWNCIVENEVNGSRNLAPFT